jgi:broad-specificity NMP kinase
MRTVTPLVAALLVVGCTSPFRQARDQAADALARGDYPAATAHLQHACRLQPGDEVCVEAKKLEVRVVNDALAVARPLCAQSRLEDCLEALRPARGVSQAPELRQVVDDVARSHLSQCEAFGLTAEDDVVTRIRCVEAFRDRVATPEYAANADQERARAAQVLETLARDRRAKNVATALATARLAECLAPNPMRSAVADEAATALRAQQQVPLAVMLGAEPLHDAALCEQLEAASGNRVVCVNNRGVDAVGLWLIPRPAPMQHSQQTFVRDARYVVRVDRYRNPRYDELTRQVARQTNRFDAADREYQLARADCETAESRLARANYCQQCAVRDESEATCNRVKALRTHREQLESQLNDARSALNNTAEILEQEVTDTFRYEEVQHHWSQVFDVTVRVVDADGTRDQVRRFEASADGVSRPGFEPAGVVASSAIAPESQALFDQVFPSMFDAARLALESELAQREGQALARCASGDGECRLRASWYRQPEVSVPWMAALKQRVDARALPWPAVACTRGLVASN